MHIDSLQKFFASSPAVRLIRSPHAFWIVDFLYEQFKNSGRITRTHSELIGALDSYLDQLTADQRLADGKGNSREKADTYLATWCSASIGWLKRFIEDGPAEPSYQLTAEFEKALSFVTRASREARFVGTESRLRNILETLESVVAGVADDPQVRLRQLELQRDEIEKSIARIRSSPDSCRMSNTQVLERFSLATQQLELLKSEFRAVEDRFKSITRNVQQKVLTAVESRGDILQYALDNEDMLKQGDQGQSFFEFLKLLHSPSSQDRITALILQLERIDSIAAEHEDLDSIRAMLPTLIAEAEKILRTTQHLSVTLRRLLDARSTRHHQQLAHLLRDILGAAASRSESPPEHVGIDIEVELEIQSPMDRPFWLATEPFEAVQLQLARVDPKEQAAVLQQLAALQRIEWQAMRQNIASLTDHGDQVELEQLLSKYPMQAGAVEVLGYFQIAFDDGHRIDRTRTIELPLVSTIDALPGTRTLTLPNIIFLPKSQRRTTKSSFRPNDHMETVH